MNRRTRIGVVAGTALMLFGIVIAFVGAPLIASFFMPGPGNAGGVDDIGAMMDSMTEASRVAGISRSISFFALCISFAAFLFTAILLGAWFIKSAPVASAQDGDAAGERTN